MSARRTFLAVPYYEGFSGPCADVITYASEDPSSVYPCYRGDSHLCRNFNKLWCDALNTRKKEGWTHFAMIHADVRPYQRYWLDYLVNSQRKSGADLLSAVLPIKDDLQTSSTAIASFSGKVRKLTMSEVKRLPEIFDGNAAASALGWEDNAIPTSAIESAFKRPDTFSWDFRVLCSTGLWCCDFTQDWVEEVDKVYFNTVDRIIKRPGGKCECGHTRTAHCHTFHDFPTSCQTCPCQVYKGTEKRFDTETELDDWPFSVRLQRLGLKTAAIRMPCGHYGPKDYSTEGDNVQPIEECPWTGPWNWAKI